jgi:hypothetical protein
MRQEHDTQHTTTTNLAACSVVFAACATPHLHLILGRIAHEKQQWTPLTTARSSCCLVYVCCSSAVNHIK